jgi:tetratricopeptide (TPR) repeat protein
MLAWCEVVPRLLRLLVIAGALAGGWALSGPGRRATGVLVAALLLIAVGLSVVLVARLAHQAFEDGRHRQAGFLYRVLRLFIWDRQGRASIAVSLAGCRLARDDFAGALVDLERVRAEDLALGPRAAWLNNRAYARARAGVDRDAALADVEHAMKLRPDVPGYRHTRGVVLMALGRLDDAIADLDSVWPHLADERAPNPLLEAERCFDLAAAWEKKGEIDYARDYFRRVRAIAPGSPWALRAAEWLARHPGRPGDAATSGAARMGSDAGL